LKIVRDAEPELFRVYRAVAEPPMPAFEKFTADWSVISTDG
jgi:hypothetical protein